MTSAATNLKHGFLFEETQHYQIPPKILDIYYMRKVLSLDSKIYDQKTIRKLLFLQFVSKKVKKKKMIRQELKSFSHPQNAWTDMKTVHQLFN